MSIQRYAIFQHVNTGMRELYDESVGKEKTETFRRTSVWFLKEDAHAAEVERLANENTDLGMQVYKLKDEVER